MNAEGMSWTMVGRGTQRTTRGEQLHTNPGAHTRVHAHAHTQLQIHEEKDQKKRTGPSIEPCGTPGPLRTAAALFHGWGTGLS